MSATPDQGPERSAAAELKRVICSRKGIIPLPSSGPHMQSSACVLRISRSKLEKLSLPDGACSRSLRAGLSPFAGPGQRRNVFVNHPSIVTAQGWIGAWQDNVSCPNRETVPAKTNQSRLADLENGLRRRDPPGAPQRPGLETDVVTGYAQQY